MLQDYESHWEHRDSLGFTEKVFVYVSLSKVPSVSISVLILRSNICISIFLSNKHTVKHPFCGIEGHCLASWHKEQNSWCPCLQRSHNIPTFIKSRILFFNPIKDRHEKRQKCPRTTFDDNKMSTFESVAQYCGQIWFY